MSKIWFKTDIFDHSEHGKDEVWQNLEFLVEAKIWEFDHSGPAKDEIWLNPEILSRLENLAQN